MGHAAPMSLALPLATFYSFPISTTNSAIIKPDDVHMKRSLKGKTFAVASAAIFSREHANPPQ
jgi:hypothetical protein